MATRRWHRSRTGSPRPSPSTRSLPSSTMAELADEWSAHGQNNLWGSVPEVVAAAVRGWGRGRGARRAAGRCAHHHLHRLPGPAADDPQHVQDRRGTDALLHARGGPHPGHPRPVDLRRPLGCDGLPSDRLRAARLRLGAGGAGPGRRRPRARRSRHGCPSSTSSTGSAPRTRWRRSRCSPTTTCVHWSTRRPSPRTAPGRSPRTGRCCAGRHRIRTPSSRRAKPAIRSTPPARASCRRRWTASARSPAGATTCSTTTDTRRPSGWWW